MQRMMNITLRAENKRRPKNQQKPAGAQYDCYETLHCKPKVKASKDQSIDVRFNGTAPIKDLTVDLSHFQLCAIFTSTRREKHFKWLLQSCFASRATASQSAGVGTNYMQGLRAG